MIFLSVLTYELGRALGVEAAAREFARQVQQAPGEPRMPAASVAYNLQQLESQVLLYHPFGTRLPQLRSRCAHAMLESPADVWVMCDDDVATDQHVLRAMLEVARSPGHPAVILPCLVRGAKGEHRVNVEWGSSLVEQMAGGHLVRRVVRGGCGLVVLHRSAVVAALEYAERYRDDDGVEKRALFRDILEGERWLGEDLSFCARLSAAGVLIVAPSSGASFHAGQLLELGS